MENSVLVLLLFYIALEYFEVQWQKADTVQEMLARMYRRYRKSMLYFFLLHPTYYFAIWLILQTQMAPPAAVLLFLKTADIATKLILMQQVFEKREVSLQLREMLTMPLERWMPYIGLAVYPPLVLWALS